MFLSIHIAAGSLALILGAVALSVKKGGALHRRSGLLFVYAMAVMAITAPILAAETGRQVIGNLLGGLRTIYFVSTALLAVRPEASSTRPLHAAALAIAAAIALFDLASALDALGRPGAVPPAPMLFLFAAIMTTAALGDLRVVRHGLPAGNRRLARHLWRMCFALFIAAGSFFSIERRVARILPEPLTGLPLRMLPILLIFAAMFAWLWRLRRRRQA